MLVRPLAMRVGDDGPWWLVGGRAGGGFFNSQVRVNPLATVGRIIPLKFI